MTTQRQKTFESSKERKHGAKLIITKKDGQLIEGELITVKPNSLLLLNAEGRDVSVKIEEIKIIRRVKKSKAWLGAGIGSASGIVISSAVIAFLETFGGDESFLYYLPEAMQDWVIIGLPCAILGALIGALLGTDKTIQIEGMTDLEIQEVMDKLRKKARIRDYR